MKGEFVVFKGLMFFVMIRREEEGIGYVGFFIVVIDFRFFGYISNGVVTEGL